MPRPTRVESEIQLLVEGNDQRNFFEAFIEHLSIPHVQIQNFGGIRELGSFLLALRNAPGFGGAVKSVGIVRDAELSASSAFDSVLSSLKGAGLDLPERPEIPSLGTPSICVLLLPGANKPGMLETLLCETLRGTPEESCIDSFFQCIAAAKLPAIKRLDKAKAWAYLTTKPDPHHSVGVATKKGYWGDLDQPLFSDICSFLKTLQRVD